MRPTTSCRDWQAILNDLSLATCKRQRYLAIEKVLVGKALHTKGYFEEKWHSNLDATA